MQTFTEHFTTPGHLLHLEDLLLYPNGARDILRVIQAISNPSANATITMKWDGAPSILFGPDPNDGQFFVATKSAFNVTPKYIKDPRDIARLYPEPGKLADVLTVCWERLSPIAPPVVLQGDVLFGPSIVVRDINGILCWVFTPNTLTYAVPVMSPLGQAMTGTSFGIALHTMYPVTSEEHALRRLQPIPITPQVFSQLRRDPNTLLLDAEQSVLAESLEADVDVFLAFHHVVEQFGTLGNVEMPPEVVEIMQRFLNHCIRQSDSFTVDNLTMFLVRRQAEDVLKRSTPRGQTAIVDRYRRLLTYVQTSREGFVRWMRAYTAVGSLKLAFLRHLTTTSPAQTFIERDGGLIPTAPEGFVVTVGDLRVKLVNRREFSRLNFLYRQF